MSTQSMPHAVQDAPSASVSSATQQQQSAFKDGAMPPTPAQNTQQPSLSALERWMHWMNHYSPSLVLQNKGATARDHLANERTYLAYLRTSLSLVTVGIAVTQLFRLNTSPATPHTEIVMGKVVGALFVALGFVFILFGAIRYFYAQTLMVKGLFPASRGSITIASLALIAVTIFIFILSVILP